MVEKRIERVREKEKSVLYKAAIPQEQIQRQRQEWEQPTVAVGREQQQKYEKASTLSDQETATIESQLSAEQLQLFAEENDMMLRHYEDTLSKVQFVPSRFYSFFFQQIYTYYLVKKRRKIPPRNLFASTNPRLAPLNSRRIHLSTCHRCIHHSRERRQRKQGTQARKRAKEYGADGVLVYGWIVCLVGCLGCYLLISNHPGL